MTQPGGNGNLFTVVCSGLVAAAIKDIHDEATSLGVGPSVTSALRTIFGRLRHDPEGFGEPLYHLPSLRLQIRAGGVAPLIVTYGVHQDRSLVFIKDVKSLGGYGF